MLEVVILDLVPWHLQKIQPNQSLLHAFAEVPRRELTGTKFSEAKNSYDFIGLNYYTHALTSPFIPQKVGVQLPKREHEIMTEF